MLVKRGKRDFIIGAAWHMSQDKADLKELVNAHEGEPRVMLNANGAVWVGFHKESRKPAIAAALVFASVFPDLIVIEQLPDDRFWVCAIHQGMPAPGRDLIVEANEVRGVVMDWMQFFPSAPIYGELEGAHSSSEAAWDRVLEAIASKEVSAKQLRSFRIERVMSTKEVVRLAIILLAFGSIGGGVWYFLGADKGQDNAADLANRAAQEAKQKEIARLVDEHKNRVLALRQEVDSVRNVDALDAWLALYRAQPISKGGYQPYAVKCNIAALSDKHPCTIEWRGQDGVRSSDRFALDATRVGPQVQAPPSEQVSPLATQTGADADYSYTVNHLVPQTEKTLQYAPAGSFRNIARIRAVLIDDARAAAGVAPSIGPFAAMTVPGVPDANLPDATVAYKAEVSLAASGWRALSEIELTASRLMNSAAGLGLVVGWREVSISSTSKTDGIRAVADVYLVEPR